MARDLGPKGVHCFYVVVDGSIGNDSGVTGTNESRKVDSCWTVGGSNLKRPKRSVNLLIPPQDGPGLNRRDILADREPAQELLDLRARRQAVGREVVKKGEMDTPCKHFLASSVSNANLAFY